MCGIAGILLSPGASASAGEQREQARVALGRMVGAIQHRGPDDCGETVLNNRVHGVLGLGHTRLSIIDLSPAGHQPMLDLQTGNYLSFNGEIYNHRELREALACEFADWQSQSDTEVILKAYRKWGVDCIRHLRGMFAFALWDQAAQRLLLARDRLGIKPLYYYAGADLFIFASEVRAILASELVKRRVDHLALSDYLTYQSIPTPRTLIEGIKTLLPGCWLTVDAAGKITTQEYWNLLQNRSDEAGLATKTEARRRVAELLREATELHLVSDVPVGVFLSGGIDSSAIVALMRELGHTPRTFSVVFGESSFDESSFAREIAQCYRTSHTEIRLSDQALLDQLPNALTAQDQPSGDGINTYIVAKAVKEAGITVALSGLGGDEFFAGYPSFKLLTKTSRYLRLMNHVPLKMRNLGARAAELFSKNSIRLAKATTLLNSDGSLAEMYPIIRQVLSPSQRRLLLSERWRQLVSQVSDSYVDLLQAAFTGKEEPDFLARISYAEGRTYMHDVLLRDTDQMSMAHALEVRVPLLDHKLVEYVMGLPDRYKLSNGTPKPLLVESLNGLLPRGIVHRTKQGFVLPFAVWMRGGLRQFCEERLRPERVHGRGIFEASEVQKLWTAFLQGSRSVSWSRLWVLVALEEWLEQNQVSTAG
jgi:asparagine synthase (glutamine-hydrolysing)